MSKIKRTKGERIFGVFNYIFLFTMSLTCVLPFVHLLAVSFSSSTPVAAGQVLFWPKGFTLQSYSFALSGRFPKSMFVSIARVALGVSVNMILMALTAYPLSKSAGKLKGRNAYMVYFIITMIINGGIIPTYLVVVKLGLLNSIWALILPSALPVSNMIILMNFIRNMPEEISEAAMIDGAGAFMVLLRIILPLLKPALATVSLFCIVAHWNDWFSGLVYIQDINKYPLQTYLRTLLYSFDDIMRLAGNDYIKLISMMNARTGRAAQLFLGALPLMLIYPFLQKYFTTGLTMGSVKG